MIAKKTNDLKKEGRAPPAPPPESASEDEDHRGKVYRENPRKKVSINSRLKAIYIIGQRKAFCGQRIPDSSCRRKETVDIEILITSRRKGDKKSWNLLE